MTERRDFLKIAVGCVAGAVAFAATARATPLALNGFPANLVPEHGTQSAHAAQNDLDQVKVEEVRWHGHHGHWSHRRWGHRHWGWRHRHWGWRRRRSRHYARRCWRDRWGYLRCRRRYYW